MDRERAILHCISCVCVHVYECAEFLIWDRFLVDASKEEEEGGVQKYMVFIFTRAITVP